MNNQAELVYAYTNAHVHNIDVHTEMDRLTSPVPDTNLSFVNKVAMLPNFTPVPCVAAVIEYVDCQQLVTARVSLNACRFKDIS